MGVPLRSLLCLVVAAGVALAEDARMFTVTFLAGPGGSLKGKVVQRVPAGGSASAVMAVPAPGHAFNAWTGPGFASTHAADLNLHKVTRDLTLTAQFGGGGVGELAADIRGIDATGAPCALSDFAGQVIVLDVSAGWCYWCQVDAPEVQALSRHYQGRGVQVVTVLSEDVNGAGPCTRGNLQAWADAYQLTFRVQNDASGVGNGVAERVYVAQPASGGFPTTVVIDKSFRVRYLEGGYDDGKVRAQVDALLAR